MVICGQEFDFSALNADDIERLETANEKAQRAGAVEAKKFQAGGMRICDYMRVQARLTMAAIDEVLGAGASARLGLDENNSGPIYDVMDALFAGMVAEKKRYENRIPKPQQPMNRQQRRAQQKQKHGHGRKPQAVTFPAQAKPAAAQMVERVDKAARRKALLAELAALDD